jgi:hypothetical protein
MRTSTRSRALVAAIATTLVIVGLVAPGAAPSATALSGSEFRAGNIISDALFYDTAAMTQAEIQGFLNKKIGTCSNGLCLNVLQASVDSHPAAVSASTGNTICKAFSGGSLSAAAIIYRAQIACGISAKVILVTLQKEQGLISGPVARAPGTGALSAAMGMACPDTGGCQDYARGFGNQIYLGAKQLMTYKADRFAKQPGVNYIQYNPNPGCGGTNVNIQNYATAALYSYTPYQPNAAALANLGGTGNSCSSYGNRNFWVYYTEWFGSTHGAPAVSTDLSATVDAIDSSGVLWMYRVSRTTSAWAARIQLATGLAGGRVIGAGDFNGDGHRDVLVIDATGNMWDYPTDGQDGVGDRKAIPGAWGALNPVLSPGDLSGDGVPDLLAVDASGDLWLYKGTGTGGLAPRVRVGHGWGGMSALVGIGDFDGDGANDLVARDSAGALWLYPGTGHSGWKARRQIGHGWNGMTALVGAGDFTRDHHPDLLARDAAGVLWDYPGTGTGGFKKRGAVGSGWQGMTSLSGPGATASGRVYVEPPGVGDLNGDGIRDIIAQDAAGTLWLYPGSGTGGWLPRQNLATGWNTNTATFGVGDFDRNGVSDIMTRDAGDSLNLLTRQGDGTFSKAQVGHGWGAFTQLIGAGDITGDGAPDVLAIDGDGALWLYAGDGSGGLRPGVQVGHGWNTLNLVVNAGDIDGDGHNDLLARDPAGNLWFYQGNGLGGWAPKVQVGHGWQGFTAIVSPGDLTGDHIPDLLARTTAGALMLYAGNGPHRWAKPRQVGSGWQGMAFIS